MHDISGLLKWVGRPEWEEAIDARAAIHLAALNEYDVDIDGLAERIGEDAIRALEFFSFEDFLACSAGQGSNPIDDYLARRGWKETASTRSYLEALRISRPSAYEVSSIEPGKSFMARDLILGGEPRRVEERTGSTMLREWDIVAARIMTVRDRTIMSGAALTFRRETVDQLVKELSQLLESVRDSQAQISIEPNEAQPLASLEWLLHSAAFMFSTVWLRDALQQTNPQNAPELRTFEGDSFEPIVLQFHIVTKVTQARIREIFDAASPLRRDGRNFWNWVDPDAGAAVRGGGHALSVETRLERGELVIGTVEISGRDVLLHVVSRPRAVRGTALLIGLLGDLVRHPVEIESDDEHDVGGLVDLHDPTTASIVAEMIENHYRRVLDEPIPMLGDQTPRQAARTDSGRAKVVEWLKHIENGLDAQPYDLNWMWHELGLADMRRNQT